MVTTILEVLVTSSTVLTKGTNVQQFAGTTPLEVLRFMLRIITPGEYRLVNALVIPSFTPDQIVDNVTVSFH